MKVKFYKCRHCGNVVMKFVDSGVPVVCCGEPMHELVPNTTDGSGEKHLPAVTMQGDGIVKIEVGSVHHPMTPEHHIAFIYIEFEDGGLRIDLAERPEAWVSVGDREIVAIYEYCNLHGLWCTKI